MIVGGAQVNVQWGSALPVFRTDLGGLRVWPGLSSAGRWAGSCSVSCSGHQRAPSLVSVQLSAPLAPTPRRCSAAHTPWVGGEQCGLRLCLTAPSAPTKAEPYWRGWPCTSCLGQASGETLGGPAFCSDLGSVCPCPTSPAWAVCLLLGAGSLCPGSLDLVGRTWSPWGLGDAPVGRPSGRGLGLWHLSLSLNPVSQLRPAAGLAGGTDAAASTGPRLGRTSLFLDVRELDELFWHSLHSQAPGAVA